MTQLLEKILKDFPERHYTTIRFPVKGEYIREAADAFSNFLTLPEETKRQFKGLLIPGEKKSSLGYEEKDRKQGNKDDKWFFHYNPALKEMVPDLFRTQNDRINDFLDAAEEIYDGVEIVAARLSDALEPLNPGITERFFPHDKSRLFYLRFLAYKPVEENGKLANGHYDQSPWTIAIGESRKGLRIGSIDKLVEVEKAGGESVLFCGPNVKNMIPKEYHEVFKPGFHDVIEKPDSIDYKPGIPRWAVVAFLWPHGLEYMNYDDAHPTARKEGFTEGKMQHEHLGGEYDK